MDPGYKVCNLNYLFNYSPIDHNFCHHMALLSLVTNLVYMLCHLYYFQIWQPQVAPSGKWRLLAGGATCVGSKYDHELKRHLVQNLATSFGSKIDHKFASLDVPCIALLQIWPPGCVTRIATLPWIAPLALSVSIELVSSSTRVTSVKSNQRYS